MATPDTVRVRKCPKLLSSIDRLPHGPLWQCVAAMSAISAGLPGTRFALVMALTSAASIVLAEHTHRALVRTRAFVRVPLGPGVPAALARFGAPSRRLWLAGACGTLACAAWPAMTVPMIGLLGLLALARTARGLRYPLDVAAGLLLGMATALPGASLLAG